MAKLTLLFKGTAMGEFPVSDGEMTIGRDPGCDITIDSLAISPVHARIITWKGSSVLKDLDSGDGVFVNQNQVFDYQLEDSDLIRIGKHNLRFEQTAEAPEAGVLTATPSVQETSSFGLAESMEPGWLQIQNGREIGRIIKLKSSITDLGKLGLLPAIIVHRSDGYYISSLTDDVALTVAGMAAGQESRRIQDGDMIQVGDTMLQFYQNSA